jgi:hypothetical protein
VIANLFIVISCLKMEGCTLEIWPKQDKMYFQIVIFRTVLEPLFFTQAWPIGQFNTHNLTQTCFKQAKKKII